MTDAIFWTLAIVSHIWALMVFLSIALIPRLQISERAFVPFVLVIFTWAWGLTA